MTNEQIITTIVVALISSFANVIFEKIFGPYIPDRKKLSSYIKTFLRFIVPYALPIAAIIWLMIGDFPVNKLFVLGIASNFVALGIHFQDSMNIFRDFIDLHRTHVESIKQVTSILEEQDKDIALLKEKIDKLTSN